MQFNYFEYMFFFIPGVIFIYFFICRKGFTASAKWWLLACSIAFYAYLNVRYLPILLASIAVNYFASRMLAGERTGVSKKAVLTAGICFNVALLGYFKYTDFFIKNINYLFSSNIPLLKILFPLGISFYTFVQIAFLVESYLGQVTNRSFLDYSLLIAFFPKIIQGPISRFDELSPQLTDPKNMRVNYEHIARGLFLVSIGLFKKLVLADNLGVWATQAFDHATVLNFFEAWFASLSYTLQIYFDFCGYTDVAVGVALMFNIRLVHNFNTPYRALSLQDFWRRWHITLSTWLNKYLYTPMVINRRYLGRAGVILSLIVTFTICGLWHGASWNYIAFGFIHGIGLSIDYLTQKRRTRFERRLPTLIFSRSHASRLQAAWGKHSVAAFRFFCWFITFNFVNASFVIFRAADFKGAAKIFRGMAGLNGVMLPEKLKALGPTGAAWLSYGSWLADLGEKQYYFIYLILAAGIAALAGKNSMETSEKLKPSMGWALLVSLLFGIGVIHTTQVTEFIYANF